jgi:hypothetical protein
MKIKNYENSSSCFRYQPSDSKTILVNFLNDKSNNSKWLNYASRKFLIKSMYDYTGCLSPEDYVSEAKVIILDIVIVEDTSCSITRFRIDKNGESIFLSRKDLFSYFFLLIKWEMSHSFRDEQNTVPMPQWNNNNDGEPAGDDDILLCRDNPGNDFVVKFDDPYDETIKYNSKEFIEECCHELEREDVLYRIIFEELLDGSANRFIAAKYKLPIRRVENISKTIHRRIRQISEDRDRLMS